MRNIDPGSPNRSTGPCSESIQGSNVEASHIYTPDGPRTLLFISKPFVYIFGRIDDMRESFGSLGKYVCMDQARVARLTRLQLKEMPSPPYRTFLNRPTRSESNRACRTPHSILPRLHIYDTMASRPTASRAPTGTAANPARRNLFHGHHLIRRPTRPSTAGGASTTASGTANVPDTRDDDSSDILMRDQNGDPQVQMPQLLPMEDEQPVGGNEEGLQSEKERSSTPWMPWVLRYWLG